MRYTMDDDEDPIEAALPTIPRYPNWGPCGEGHLVLLNPLVCVYRGMIVHKWSGFYCVTPYADLAGTGVALPEDLYPDGHVHGLIHIRCHDALTEAEALAFIEAQWAEADRALGLRQ